MNNFRFNDVAKIQGLKTPAQYYLTSAKICQPTKEKYMKLLVDFIISANINVIVNVGDKHPTDDIINLYRRLGIRYISCLLEDRDFSPDEYQGLNDQLEIIRSVIEDWENGQSLNILVHCHAGINRSALLVSKLLLSTTTYPIAEIIEQVRKSNKECRNTPALTNGSFVEMLYSVH